MMILPLTVGAAKALRESIKHWERNVGLASKGKLTKPDTNRENCSLCQLFPNCFDGCPVYMYSGESFCRNTPYSNVLSSESHSDPGDCVLACLEELQFLYGLLLLHKDSKAAIAR